jgi:hypothetical protein
MKKKLLGVAAALALNVASPALADIIDVTYTGTVSDGTDVTGVFGPPSTLFDGNAFTLTYAFDTAKGIFTSGFNSSLAGGPGFGPGIYSSPGTAVLTINGHSADFIVDPNPPSQGFSEFLVEGPRSDGTFFIQQQVNNVVNRLDTTNHYIEKTVFTNITLTIPLSLTTSYVLGTASGVVFDGQFRIFDLGFCGDNFCYNQAAVGDLSPTNVTVSVSSVPLPAALPLFNTGLAALGLLAWRRKRKVAA